MPAAMDYLPNDKALRDEAAKELAARRLLCQTAWDYYDGRHKKHLKVEPGKQDDNVTINLWKQGKDREITFLFPKMPGIELDDDLDVDSEDEQWLRKAWHFNKGLKILRRLAKYGAVDGHVFARVIPNDAHPERFPRIVALNPANALAFWRADDYEDRLWYELYYEFGGKKRRQDIVKRDGWWEILEYEQEERTNAYGAREMAWTLVGKPDEWPFERGPIVDWQHIDRPGEFYGDNEDGLIALNDKVNKVASDTSRILRFYGSPTTVIQADIEPEKIVKTEIGGAWILPRDSEVKNVEMQSDLQSSVRFTEMLVEAAKSEQRVVVMSGSAADLQRVTNLGVQTVFIDQLAKTDELWEQYEPGIADLCKTMLCVAEMRWERDIKVLRASPLPTDPMETIGVQEKELALGLVSRETVMRERLRNVQKERALMEAEEDSSGEALIRAAMRGAEDEAGQPFPLTPNPSPSGRGDAQGAN